MSDTCVLVVGAGPVGLLLAWELARRDVAVRIVDRLEQPTTESRAIVLHARSLEMLRRVGVAGEIIDGGRRTTGMTFHAGGRALARADLDTVDSPFPFSVTLAQTETERILTRRLAELGVAVERGAELVGLEQRTGGARARLRRADGPEEVLAVPWVVGTDGAHSTVRELTGARLEGSFAGESFLMADAEAEYDLARDSMHTFFAVGEGPLLVFPMGADRVRLIAQVPDGAGTGAPTLGVMQEVTDRRAGGIRLREAHWLTRFEIHHAQVPRYRLGRVLLAGDAAHTSTARRAARA